MTRALPMPCLCSDVYQRERDILTAKQIDDLLLAGRAWDLSETLSCGGIAVFPHTYLAACGSYIAACVHAALDSGADHVLALGVLHSFSDLLLVARAKERAGEDLSGNALRGVHGPRMRRGEYWKAEYSLLSFLFLWKEEIKRRGIKAPKLSIRFPFLVNKDPQSLPGMRELEAIAKDACLVATSDFCHHGVAYGCAKERALTGDAAKKHALESIQEHLQILTSGDLAKFYQHCQAIRSDSYDVGPLIQYLRAPISAQVLDVTLVDTSELYDGAPKPSWVAASLIKLDKPRFGSSRC